jgi:hypothetical protein
MDELVRIYTVCDRRPDFVKMQRDTFRRHLRDRHELVVCDNAESRGASRRLRVLCLVHRLRYVRVPDQHHENANVACSYPLDFLTQEVLARERQARYSVLIDSDMFLLKPFSFADYLGPHALAGVPQRRGPVRYLWNGLVVIDHRRLPDIRELVWACSGSAASPYFPAQLYQDGMLCGQAVDVGGPLHFYLERHPEVPVKHIDMARITADARNVDLLPDAVRAEYAPFAREELASDLLAGGAFFHYRAGSNWNRMPVDMVAAKTRILRRLVARSLGRG